MGFEYAAYLTLVVVGTLALQRFFNVRLKWTQVLRTVFPVALTFILWDAWAVWRGLWSFQTDYVVGVFIGNQPVEEIIFFFVVPFFYMTAWEIFKKKVGKKTRSRL